MDQEKREAVRRTDEIFAYSREFRAAHLAARMNGHALVSLGCGHVRCYGCNGEALYGRFSKLTDPCPNKDVRVPLGLR
jgi:hypothetical protein